MVDGYHEVMTIAMNAKETLHTEELPWHAHVSISASAFFVAVLNRSIVL